jgi:hypothetical protein
MHDLFSYHSTGVNGTERGGGGSRLIKIHKRNNGDAILRYGTFIIANPEQLHVSAA